MAVSASSARAVITELIEKYKNSECLWKVTDKNYKNKQLRQKAQEELLPILKKVDSTANMDTVTKKINSMRSAFNKEHNKVKAASRSGVGADEEYIPKLWYYDLLLFLNEKGTEVGNSSDINAILNEENDENMDQDMDISTDQASQQSTRSEPPPRSESGNSKKKERSGVCEVLSKISKRLDSSTVKTKPSFSAFGEHVTEKLRNMSSNSAKYCQKIINDAIFHAEFDNLNHTSRIVTDDIHLDRPRSRSQTSSPYFKPYRPPSTHTQSPYQSPNEQTDRPYRPPSTQSQSPYRSPNAQTDRPYRPPSTQTQSPYRSPNTQTDRPYRLPSTHTQSPYQSPNEQTDRPYRSHYTHTQSPYQSPNEQTDRPYRSHYTHTQSPYQSPNEQTDRPCRPPSTQTQSPYQSPNEQTDIPCHPPSTQTQSPYQSPNEQTDIPCRPPSTQTQSPYRSLNEQTDRPSRPPSTQIQSPYQSPNTQFIRPHQTELSQPILIELPYQPPEQQSSLQQSPASNTIIVNNADEIIDYLDQQDYDNSLSSPIIAEGDFSSMTNYLIFKPKSGN